MIECYSNNISVQTGEAVSYNNVPIKKGCSVDVSGASITFNRCGIYEVSCNATASTTSGASGSPATVTLQLHKDGVAQPQAKISALAADTTTKLPLALTTLVQVPQNNTCCACSSPTVCSIVNTADGATIDNINVIVTKLA